MKTRIATGRFYLAAIMISLLAGCGQRPASQHNLALANPASVYCEKQGGTLEIRHEKGGDTGYCHLAYGRVVEEWVLYRAAHKGH